MSNQNHNPNNCDTCDYLRYEHEGLHCYMFKDEPTEVCMQHTGRSKSFVDLKMAEKLMGLSTSDFSELENRILQHYLNIGGDINNVMSKFGSIELQAKILADLMDGTSDAEVVKFDSVPDKLYELTPKEVATRIQVIGAGTKAESALAKALLRSSLMDRSPITILDEGRRPFTLMEDSKRNEQDLKRINAAEAKRQRRINKRTTK